MTTPILQWIYPTHIMARDLVELDAPADAAPVEPVPASHRVLVCVAHSIPGPGLMTMARMVATPPALMLHLVTSSRQSELLDDGVADPTDVLGPARAQAEALGLPVRVLSFVSTEPAEEICRVAAVRDVSLILLGWHKPVLSQTLLGGVVHQVLRDATSAVGVFVDRGLGEVRRVLVPFHGSRNDRAALALAGRVQRATGAEVTVLHVVRPKRGRRTPTPTAIAELVGGGGKVTVDVVEHDSPEAAALERCGDQDLLIVGVGREWGVGDRRFGLQPERLLHDCPSSILVVRAAPPTPGASASMSFPRLTTTGA
jgi:nucleotide-binding universal stress UspA family protein